MEASVCTQLHPALRKESQLQHQTLQCSYCHHCTTVLLQSYKYLHQIFTSQSESHFSALFCYQEPMLNCLNLKTHIVSCLCHSQIPRKFKGKTNLKCSNIKIPSESTVTISEHNKRYPKFTLHKIFIRWQAVPWLHQFSTYTGKMFVSSLCV